MGRVPTRTSPADDAVRSEAALTSSTIAVTRASGTVLDRPGDDRTRDLPSESGTETVVLQPVVEVEARVVGVLVPQAGPPDDVSRRAVDDDGIPQPVPLASRRGRPRVARGSCSGLGMLDGACAYVRGSLCRRT